MDTFRWVSVIVSMILGLGVARLLLSALGVFRARRRAILDWPPLLWALAIFLQQIAFWWSLEDAAGAVAIWTLPAFLLLIGLVLALFVAAALILPFDDLAESETLRSYFDKDGRWALVGLAAFNVLAMVANTTFWDEGLLAESVRINLVLTIIPVAGFLGARRAQAAAAAAYLAVVAWGTVELSPFAY